MGVILAQESLRRCLGAACVPTPQPSQSCRASVALDIPGGAGRTAPFLPEPPPLFRLPENHGVHTQPSVLDVDAWSSRRGC